MQLSLQDAAARLREHTSPFIELLNGHGITVELYAPKGRDLQQPHDRDEIYVVTSGTGTFRNGDVVSSFAPGDLLFVPAGVVHRFETFTEDFATWVVFVGPVGGTPK
jgi:mannose-6-phosphate isomerase-like protein (cupin superfamily)